MSEQQRSGQTDLIMVTLTGRLAAEPSFRQVGEAMFCTLAVRSNYRPYVDRNGNRVTPKPHDIDCELVGQMAANAAKHLVKGQQVSIVGELRDREWKDEGHAAPKNPEGRRFKKEVFVQTINYGNKPQSWWASQGTAQTETPQVEGGTPAPAPAPAEEPVAS